MKKLITTLTALTLLFALTGCMDGTEEGGTGVGMTYGGKMGVDLGGGIVMPFDGSGLGLGYGF